VSRNTAVIWLLFMCYTHVKHANVVGGGLAGLSTAVELLE
jgi:heterodisulfide reductase subunit A-like polyferredoxin